RPAILGGVAYEISDPRARDLVLARHAGDVGTRASNPLTLHHGRSPSRLRHMPGHELAAGPASEDKDFIPFWLSHGFRPKGGYLRPLGLTSLDWASYPILTFPEAVRLVVPKRSRDQFSRNPFAKRPSLGGGRATRGEHSDDC